MSRVPSCFLLIGGVAAALCLAGLLLVTESEDQTNTSKVVEELASLSPREVVRTKIFYQVNTSIYILNINYQIIRSGSVSLPSAPLR